MNVEEITNLILENQAIIWKICNTFYQLKEDREDLFQEITIQLIKAYPKFENRSKFSTWLYRVALNTAISFKKRNQHKIIYSEINDTTVGRIDAKYEESQVTLLYKSIDQLSKIDKVVVLLYLEEKSYDEIAEITGFTVKNISVKLVRIRRKLNKILNRLN